MSDLRPPVIGYRPAYVSADYAGRVTRKANKQRSKHEYLVGNSKAGAALRADNREGRQ